MTTKIIGSGLGGTKALTVDQFFQYLENLGEENTRTEVYAAVSWVYRCIELRCNALSSIPYKIMRGETDLAEDYIIDFEELLWALEADLCIFAAGYWLRDRPRQATTELQRLNPQTVRIKTDKAHPEKGIIGYIQQIGGVQKTYKPEEMIYFREYNPNDDLGPGVAPLQVALEAASLGRNANLWAGQFFSHGAIPATVLYTEQMIPDGELDRVRTAWDRLTQGVQRAWRTIVLRKGLKPEVIQPPVGELAMTELLDGVRSQIAVAFGVPQTMLSDAANYACLPGDQLVYTPTGAVPIANLKTGDPIWQYSEDGITKNAVEAIIPQGIAPIYEIRTQNRLLRASDNHPILTVRAIPGKGGPTEYATPQSHAFEWKRADEIQRGDYIITVEELPDQGRADANGEPVHEELMELAGLWTGDGCGTSSRTLRWAIPPGPTQDIYAEKAARVFERRYERVGEMTANLHDTHFSICSAEAVDVIERLGLSGTARTKRVPDWVFGLSLPLRLAYLRGYLDSDGTVDKERGQIAFGAANKELIDDIRYLCLSCGIPVANVQHDMGREGNFGPIEIHRFTCGYPEYNRLIGTHDPKKHARLQNNGHGRRTGRYVQSKTYDLHSLRLPPGVGVGRVLSAELVGEEEVYDLATSGSHTFIAEGVVVHNTAKEHRLSFYQDTILPEANQIQAALNRQMFDELGLEFEFDVNAVEAIQKDEADKAEYLRLLVEAKIITKDEARDMLGFEEMTPEQEEELKPAMPDFTPRNNGSEPEEDRDDRPPFPARSAITVAMEADLEKWQRKALAKGRDAPFESEFIPPDVMDGIRSALADATTDEEVKAAFAAGFREERERWSWDYP